MPRPRVASSSVVAADASHASLNGHADADVDVDVDVEDESLAAANGTTNGSGSGPHNGTGTTAGGVISSSIHKQMNTEGIEAFEMPRAVVTRVAKAELPDNVQIRKDAVLAISKSATVFINYLSAVADEIAKQRSRKTISTSDVQDALGVLQFPEGIREQVAREVKAFARIEREKKAGKVPRGAAGVEEGGGGGAGGEGRAEGEAEGGEDEDEDMDNDDDDDEDDAEDAADDDDDALARKRPRPSAPTQAGAQEEEEEEEEEARAAAGDLDEDTEEQMVQRGQDANAEDMDEA